MRVEIDESDETVESVERGASPNGRIGVYVRSRSHTVSGSVWPGADAELRALWSGPDSTAEIGRKLGISKNAIVGRAHRLDLPARPSPIIRDGRVPKPRSAYYPPKITPPKNTLPPLASGLVVDPVVIERKFVPQWPSAPRGPYGSGKPDAYAVAAARRLAAKPAVVPLPPVMVYSMFKTCQYVTDQGQSGFGIKFCDSGTEPGRPYCLDHCKACYQGFRGDGLPREVNVERLLAKPMNVGGVQSGRSFGGGLRLYQRRFA